MKNKLPMEKIRKRIDTYLGTVPTIRISDDAPITKVLAPVETGLSRFIDVTNIPDMNDLPFIPERQRDFAFRYATEYKTTRIWAKEYSVSAATITRWLQQPGVRAYIAVARYEQRMFNLGQHITLQRNTYTTINNILKFKITADTIDAIGKMARFVFNTVNDPKSADLGLKKQLNVNIGFNQQINDGSEASNPYAQGELLNVTPKQIEDLTSELEELDIIADGFRREKERLRLLESDEEH
jgi:hypothetical protein